MFRKNEQEKNIVGGRDGPGRPHDIGSKGNLNESEREGLDEKFLR